MHCPLRYWAVVQDDAAVQDRHDGLAVGVELPPQGPDRYKPLVQVDVHAAHTRVDVAVQGAVSYWPAPHCVQAAQVGLVLRVHVPLR